ncbi:Coenzyme F420 hydrogenase/dehydrogenase, beta subunit C-terminal domain [Pelotomaculum propionicicum]|uniref:Ferredoxin n=1 Tax=Pelotomaculum propionicicum TaxID=258475 RepID=A0A4Y7RJM8_9FIRM|nr:Coenzyme F420 hydrogenase/dehydrogenase, beta subunit C-terminal domain [Pelotomaculum propionicicum]TEB09194.1 Ferredoxin [Pelotomaculum propionicicum]
MKDSFNDLQSTVINRGLCTACGTCAGLCPAGAIGWADDDGEPLPVLAGACNDCGICGSVCPGAEVNLPVLERFVFGREREDKVPDLGLYQEACASWASVQAVRRLGAGGGMVTALLIFALEQGIIDCALVAGFQPDKPYRTGARLAASMEEILAAAQSKYACVTVNSLLGQALEKGFRRVAVVGLPCHVHGLRKMQLLGPAVFPAESLALTVGLFCASQFYFEGTRHLLVEQMHVPYIEEVIRLSYRGGDWPGHLVADLKDGRQLTLDRHQYMYHHLMPAFKRDRCEMCVDWSSELADLSVGDYWDPKSKAESLWVCLPAWSARRRAEKSWLGLSKAGIFKPFVLNLLSLPRALDTN